MTWRERVGIEPTSRLATTSAILKTVRTTRSVRSHVGETPYFAGVFGKYCWIPLSAASRFADLLPITAFRPALQWRLGSPHRPWPRPQPHAFEDVRVEVEGNRNAGMSKPFTDDLRVNPSPESMRGVGVPQIVEAHLGDIDVAYESPECVGEALRGNRIAILLRDYKVQGRIVLLELPAVPPLARFVFLQDAEQEVARRARCDSRKAHY